MRAFFCNRSALGNFYKSPVYAKQATRKPFIEGPLVGPLHPLGWGLGYALFAGVPIKPYLCLIVYDKGYASRTDSFTPARAKSLFNMCNKIVHQKKMVFHKSYLARLAGVHPSTFRRWLISDRAVLASMGVMPRNKVLPLEVVCYLDDKYDLEVPLTR